MSIALSSPWLLVLLPGLAALIIALGAYRSRQAAAGLAIAASAVTFVLACQLVATALSGGQTALMASFGGFRWMTVGKAALTITWGLTPLSALMTLLVSFIGGLVQVYSLAYMKDEPTRAYGRYYGGLALFAAAMMLLVLADSLLALFAGWELVGVSSYLLIGHWFAKPEAARAASKAFWVNRIGDLGLLLGILMLYGHTHELGFGANVQAVAKGLIPATSLGWIAFLMFLGPIGKSAQVPLHVWLPDAMEGPTPVSALIHAATMVAAGVYFMGRLFELFVLAPQGVLQAVAAIGALTAFLAASIAVVQVDIKKILAYSTISQLGFMIMALGMGPNGYKAGLFHLVTHAFFKALLFLGAGAVIHATQTQDVREMGGLKTAMPITRATFLIGALSLAGLPFLTAGFWSKEAIFHAAAVHNRGLLILAALAATMTAFYAVRLYCLTFEGTYRGKGTPHEAPRLMTVPLIVLAVPAVAAGWLDTGLFGHAIDSLVGYGGIGVQTVVPATGLNWFLVAVSTLSFGVGSWMAYAMYVTRQLSAEDLAKQWSGPYDMLRHRYYIDELYDALVKRVLLGWAWLAETIDRYVIDGLVNGAAIGTVASGEGLKLLQSGRVQTYVLVAVLTVAAVVHLLTRI